MQKVYVKFPKTGLGNMLLVWARAALFAHINQLPYHTSSWWGLRWGALLRREKKKRLYMGYFKETPFFTQLKFAWLMTRRKLLFDPPIDLRIDESNAALFVFKEVITGQDLFASLRNHVPFVKNSLYELLTPRMHAMLGAYQPPFISLHVRRGDFKIGNQTTPINFFVDAVQLIRQSLQCDIPVTIFTDAHQDELKDLLQLPNVSIAEDKPDILDILLMSKSKLMVLSKSSTFSYWAAFLSDALVIRPADDWQEKIKDSDTRTGYQEWKWNGGDHLFCTSLAESVRSIFQQTDLSKYELKK